VYCGQVRFTTPEVPALDRPQDGLGLLDDPLDGEAEVFEDVLVRPGRAEGVLREGLSFGTDVPVPSEADARLHRHAGGDVRRDDLFPVRLVLGLEEFPAGHADHARPDAVRGESGLCIEGEVDFRSGRDEDHLGRAALGLGEDVSAARDPGGVGHGIDFILVHPAQSVSTFPQVKEQRISGL